MFGGGSGGIIELQQFIELKEKSNPVTKKLGKSPKLWKMASTVAIPAAAVVGGLVMPSRRLAVDVIGGAVTGVGALIGKSRLDIETESAALPALAQAIVDNGVDNIDMAQGEVENVKDTFGVNDEDFADMCKDVYKTYLIGMVRNPMAKTSELGELKNLKTILELDNLLVGEAHAAAAEEFYRQLTKVTSEEDLRDDEDHPDRMSLDKFLFLSERSFKQGGETEEAFKYEMSRIAKAFGGLSLSDVLERVAEVAEPFYRRALASTRSKLDTGAVNSDMLARARATLGIEESVAADLHVQTFADEVKSLLGTVDGEGFEVEIDSADVKFPAGSMDRLAQLQEVLGLTEEDASYEISSEANRHFEGVALEAMEGAISGDMTPEDAWEAIATRRDDLCLKEESMKSLLTSIVMQALGKPLEETLTYAKVNNEQQVYEKLLDALEAKLACFAVLQLSGWEDFDESHFFDPTNSNSASGFIDEADRMKMYQIFLVRSVRNSESGEELTDDMFDEVQEVQSMLGIGDAEAQIQFRKSFGPALSKELQIAVFEVTGDDYTPALVENLKKKIDAVIENYRLPADMVKEFAASNYNKAVEIINQKSPSGIPTPERMEALDKLRDLLQLEKEATYAPHMQCFGRSYRTGVLEALGGTGVIRPEFRQPLDDLRDRLGLPEDATKKIFLEAIEEKMIPMVEFLGTELERTMLTQQQLAQKKGKDFGEDMFKSGKGAAGRLGIGADGNIMTDCMNLVDFYTENDIAEEKEVGKKTVEKKVPAEEEGGEETTVTEEVPVYETTYPITALGTSCIEIEMAELLYRQFVVGGFTTQGPQGERYEAAKATFGGILGLTSEKMEEIGGSIGETVYENFISNAMTTKGQLDQQDMMFLANIQTKLGLSSEQGEKMMLDVQKKILVDEANAVMGGEPSAADVKAYREKCNSMGLELGEDLELSKSYLTRMFEIEVVPGLMNGEITVESAELLTEIQESLGLTPEECEELFEGILDKRASAVLTNIKGELLRGREENATDLIKKLVRFASFVDGELGLEIDEANAYAIFNLYEKFDFSEEEKESVEEKKKLLKVALGIS